MNGWHSTYVMKKQRLTRLYPIPLPIFRSTTIPAMAALETFLRSMSEMPYMAPKAGMSLQSMACRRRAETFGSIVNGASFWDDNEGVVNPFSFSTFSRCAAPWSLRVMFFAMMLTEATSRIA